jgi:threonine/homoserine/homoserine lactone efflux protein
VGVHGTFGLLLLALALGLSVAAPRGAVLRVLEVTGGILLLWLAVDGVRAETPPGRETDERRRLPPTLRGAMAIVLNPGGWLFLGTVASPLLATASQRAGVGSAVVAALALVAGAAVGDLGLVLVGGLGVRRAGEGLLRTVRLVLAALLAALGVWLLLRGALP